MCGVSGVVWVLWVLGAGCPHPSFHGLTFSVLPPAIFPPPFPPSSPPPPPPPLLLLSNPQFLLRVLTGWVKTLGEAGGEAPVSGCAPRTVLGDSGPGADWWPSLCQDLGPLLQVSQDILRRHLVCELYNQGLDQRAEEVNTHTQTLIRINNRFRIKRNASLRKGLG